LRVWPEQVRRSGWPTLFGVSDAPLRLHVDIGFGNGEFLIALARSDPRRAVVGIERSFKRVLKVAQRLSRSDLRNVRLLGVDAAWAVREAFEDESVESFWINFPDPWPKRRHRRRRFVEPGFVRDLSRRLMAGGSLHIATDDPAYAAVIRSAIDGEPLLENARAVVAQPAAGSEFPTGARPDDRRASAPTGLPDVRRELPPTAFQRLWIARQRPCFFFDHRRVKPVAARGSDRPVPVAS